jgi:hypothetical protein
MQTNDRRRSLSEIASIDDDGHWMLLLRERISEIAFDEGEEVLPEVARVVHRAERVITNTLSGGMCNFVGPSDSLDEARAIQAAMVSIGAKRMADVLRRACDLVESTPASAWEEVDGYEDDDGENGSPAWTALRKLEREFWDIGFDEPNQAIHEFIWRQRDEFRRT